MQRCRTNSLEFATIVLLRSYYPVTQAGIAVAHVPSIEGKAHSLSKTISSTYSSGFTLSSATSPLSITSTGVINKSSGSYGVITGAAGAAWTITNSGHVNAGVELAGIFLGRISSAVTNAVIVNNTGGVIAGKSYGVFANGPTTLTNHGTVSSSIGNSAVYFLTNGTVFNYGVISGGTAGSGVYLKGGGSLFDAAGATIASYMSGDTPAVRLGHAGTVTVAGTISGETSFRGEPYTS
jgi:hypothetical protein